jgi:predicted N-acyltransferase
VTFGKKTERHRFRPLQRYLLDVDKLEISFVRRMADIPSAEWDALAAPYGNPLLGWGFLALLEESLSIRPETGWTPTHALARQDGELVAAAPFYVKTHSWGEFVFDFEFAEIARRAKAEWYPKLVGMVPVTPAPAWRVLVRAASRELPGEEGRISLAVIDAASRAARKAGLGGAHILWPEDETAALLRARGSEWAAWDHQAFLWTDDGYGDFGGYLDSFSKNMRRNVRRERDAVAAAGVTTRFVGSREAAAKPAILAAMADLYESHNDKFGPWAAKFLERDFFLRLPEFMPEGWALSAAFESARAEAAGEPVALAFLLEGKDRLYGRFWGARREVPGLHFELCYYLPMEHALAKGIGSFDPGMGSPHKARRGFRSVMAPSFHQPFDRRLADLMNRVLPGINAEERSQAAALDEEMPFKRSPG